MSYKKINRKSATILSLLAVATVFQKTGTVTARKGVMGEEIQTDLKNGTKETVNKVTEEGSMVVTNPGGEQYIISKEKFESRYEQTDKPGVYAAKGFIRAIKNPENEPIEIMASWGEVQTGGKDCWIADVCDENGNTDGEPYLIDNEAFQETYTEATTATV